jgi:hypothetical protein
MSKRERRRARNLARMAQQRGAPSSGQGGTRRAGGVEPAGRVAHPLIDEPPEMDDHAEGWDETDGYRDPEIEYDADGFDEPDDPEAG